MIQAQWKPFVFLSELNVKGRDTHWKIRRAVETTENTLYNFDQFKSKNDAPRRPVKKLIFNVPSRKDLNDSEIAVEQGIAISKGAHKARDLANCPPNVLTPAYFADEAKKLAVDNAKVECQILDQTTMKEMGMGAFISVAQGSANEGKMIILNYKGADEEQKPIVLVGKGITFDTGGISLKPGERMDEMKYDMGGAAGVFGTFVAITRNVTQG